MCPSGTGVYSHINKIKLVFFADLESASTKMSGTYLKTNQRANSNLRSWR